MKSYKVNIRFYWILVILFGCTNNSTKKLNDKIDNFPSAKLDTTKRSPKSVNHRSITTKIDTVYLFGDYFYNQSRSEIKRNWEIISIDGDERSFHLAPYFVDDKLKEFVLESSDPHKVSALEKLYSRKYGTPHKTENLAKKYWCQMVPNGVESIDWGLVNETDYSNLDNSGLNYLLTCKANVTDQSRMSLNIDELSTVPHFNCDSRWQEDINFNYASYHVHLNSIIQRKTRYFYAKPKYTEVCANVKRTDLIWTHNTKKIKIVYFSIVNFNDIKYQRGFEYRDVTKHGEWCRIVYSYDDPNDIKSYKSRPKNNGLLDATTKDRI